MDSANPDRHRLIKRHLTRWTFTESPTSIYFGGGTPGLWKTSSVALVLKEIDAFLKIKKETEITLEANPHEVTLDLAREWVNLGINRISLGTQSFHQHYLNHLKRHHTPEQARKGHLQGACASIPAHRSRVPGLRRL